MAGEILIFDASASNVDGTDPGTAVEVGPNDDLRLMEFDAPAPPQSVIYAGSVDTEGAVPSSRKHDNRVITLKLLCMTAASLRLLEDKVAKVAREGGTLKWTLPNSETGTFDLLASDELTPTFNKLYYVRAGAFTEVQVSLPAAPYIRGPQETATLSSSTATAKAPHVFTVTGVKGTVPAVGTLEIGNVTNVKRWGAWAVQSRRYSSASSAALFFEAEDCVAEGATANAGPSGASGGGANKVMRHLNVDTAGTPAFSLPASLTHVGTFRVYARVQVTATNSGTVSAWIEWSPRVGQAQVVNTAVPIVSEVGTPIEGDWVVVDLGIVNIPLARKGTQGWEAELWASSTVATDDLDWDWVALFPVDEGFGVVTDGDPSGLSGIQASTSVEVTHETVEISNGGGTWRRPSTYEGKYLRVPPAGAEARTVRFIAVLLDGTDDRTSTVVQANNIDATTATLVYTPRYLTVPST